MRRDVINAVEDAIIVGLVLAWLWKLSRITTPTV
jgi:hypothetical protein